MGQPEKFEGIKLNVKEVARVVKYDGDAPKPGEDKEPFEIVQGEYDRKTNQVLDPVVTFRRPGVDPQAYAPFEKRERIGDDYHHLLAPDHQNYRPLKTGESDA